MVQPGGKVIGIEHIPELAQLSRQNLVKDPEHKKMIDDEKLMIVNGDGRKGYPDEGFVLAPGIAVWPEIPSSCFRILRPSTTEMISPSSPSSASMIQPPRSPRPRNVRIRSYTRNILKKIGIRMRRGNQELNPDPRGVKLMYLPRKSEKVLSI
jgi:Protein-L-isoaspartate(D-aspartate) O-methyltransferase (PCMT)